MKTILIFVSIFAFTTTIFGQSNKDRGIPEAGTYQIIVKDAKHKLVFTTDYLEGMEDKRMKKESVSVMLDENIYLYLPSLKSIKDPEFEKLEAVLYE